MHPVHMHRVVTYAILALIVPYSRVWNVNLVEFSFFSVFFLPAFVCIFLQSAFIVS